MKTILTMMTAILMMSSCVNAHNVQKVTDYEVQNFSSIEMDGVGKIVYTQSEACSVRAEGDSVLIDRTKITYEDGCVLITQKGETNKHENVTFYISSPTLVKVSTQGVGSFESTEPTVFDNDFTFEMEGVGAVKFSDLTCKNLNFHQEGVGAAEVSVKCKNVYYHSEGVGASNLKIEADSLNLRNEGVGAVKVKGQVKYYNPYTDGLISKISDKNLKVGE